MVARRRQSRQLMLLVFLLCFANCLLCITTGCDGDFRLNCRQKTGVTSPDILPAYELPGDRSGLERFTSSAVTSFTPHFYSIYCLRCRRDLVVMVSTILGENLPKRWEMALLLMSAIALAYMLRVNISVAAVKMKDELNWSHDQKGYILSAFYWGYMLGQIPASMYAQVHGAKWLLGLSIAISSFLSLLVPIACRHSFSMALMIRVLIGFFESAMFPSVFHYFPLWVAASEKTFMIPFIVSGTYIGEVIAFSLSGYLAESAYWGGWPSIFYLFGIAGLMWFPLWIYAAHESPAEHPTISKEEIAFINKGKDINYDVTLKPLTDASHPDYASVELDHSSNGDDYNGTSTTKHSNSESRPLIHRSSNLSNTMPRSNSNSHLLSPNNTNSARTRSMSKAESAYATSAYSTDTIHYSKTELIARTPWKQFVTHPVALALLACKFGYGWIGFTLLSEMPSYLTDILGFDLGHAGLLCVFPYLALLVSTLLFARFFDYLQREKGWEVSRVRRVAMYVAYLGSGAGLVVCCFVQEKYTAYGFMVLAQALFGAAQSGIGCVWTDTAPQYSSQLNSVGNTIAALAGVAGPIVVSFFVTTWPGVKGWRVAFIFTFYLSALFCAVWGYFIKAEIVPALNTPIAIVSSVK